MRMAQLFGGASRYAHLAALVPARGARAEEEDRDDKTTKKSRRAEEDDDDEPKGKKSKAEDPEQYPDDSEDEPKGKKSRAEDDGDDDEPKGKKSKAEDGDDEDEDEPKGKKSRRAKAEDDDDEDAEDDDDKEEMTGKSASAKARRRERARCKAIFSHPAAAANLPLAASLAFDTTQTRKEALAVLKGQSGRAPAHDVRGDRGRRNPDLGPGGEGQLSGKQALTSSWDRALGKAGVQPRK